MRYLALLLFLLASGCQVADLIGLKESTHKVRYSVYVGEGAGDVVIHYGTAESKLTQVASASWSQTYSVSEGDTLYLLARTGRGALAHVSVSIDCEKHRLLPARDSSRVARWIHATPYSP